MTETQPHPKASARSVLSAPRRPVARYRPVVIAAGLAGVVLLVGLGFMIAFGGGHRRPQDTAATPPPEPAAAPAAELDRRLPAGYGDLAVGPPPEIPKVAAPSEPEGSGLASAEAQRRTAEVTAARASPAFFGGPEPAAALAAAADPTADADISPSSPAAALSAKERFIAATAGGSPYVASLPRQPISPYELKAGSIIPAALVTGLNSDLPGPVIAQVTAPVYDHQTGRIVLIPQGARLVGRYDSQATYGQDRVLMVWTRLVFPDGRSMDLGAMVGADVTGASGLSDAVDTHAPRLARAAGLSTIVAMGAAAAQNALNRGSDNLVLQDGAGGLAASASQVGQRLVDRDLQRAPTLKVRPGWPLRILLDKDLILPPSP